MPADGSGGGHRVAAARVFFALWPSPAAAASVAGQARPLATAIAARPMRADTLHLTLHFVGDVDRRRLPELLQAGAATAASGECRRFLLRLDQARYWRHNGIVVLAASAPCAPAARLAAALAAATGTSAASATPREFVPHLTLLRGVGPMATAALANWKLTEPMLIEANSFRLVESLREASGARYRVLGEWPLALASSSSGAAQ
jgi:2'-5' RNA ligase